MILRIIRWLRGYLLFTVTGRFPERFINLLNKNGVRYWNLVPTEKGYTGQMAVRDYLNIRKMARNCSVLLKCKEKTGLPFFIKKYKPRKGLIIGAVCAILIMSILNQFIWVIDIKGTEKIGEESIRDALKSVGLQIGTYKGSLNIRSVVREATVLLPDVGWMSINALNNIAYVEVREKSKQPKLSDDTSPCNIKASQDGVITKTLVSRGTCVVKKGTAVAKNQLLVSAVVEGKTEEIDLNYVHSSAKIYADVNEEKRFSVKLNSTCLIPNEKYTEKSNLNFLGLSIPVKTDFSQAGVGLSVFKTYRLNPNNVILPLGTTNQRQYYYNESSRKINIKTAKNILKKKIATYECFKYKNNNVKSRKIIYSKTPEKLSAKVIYVINKNIALPQKIQVDNEQIDETGVDENNND